MEYEQQVVVIERQNELLIELFHFMRRTSTFQ